MGSQRREIEETSEKEIGEFHNWIAEKSTGFLMDCTGCIQSSNEIFNLNLRLSEIFTEKAEIQDLYCQSQGGCFKKRIVKFD